jgi:hypothetical protein
MPRGGLLGLGRIAERAMPVDERPLCVLLLPRPLEETPARELASAPGVVVVEPARLDPNRLPDALADGVAAVQARRLALPGIPRAIAIFDPRQYRLARALLTIHPDAELWYGGEETGPMHELAAARAAMRFRDVRALWGPMERLGVESGRLGSERLVDR